MKPIIYNISIFAGIALASIGVGFVYWPAGLITAGALVIALTLYAVERVSR